MRLPSILRKEHRTPVVLTAVLTLFAWNAIGFGWFGLPGLGFMTAGAADQHAVARMEQVAVPLAAQLCAIRFNEQDPVVVAAKAEKLKSATYTYAKTQELDERWVTLGDARNVNQRVVDACATLILAAPAQKSADLTNDVTKTGAEIR
jgi:hypothetical protein